MTPHLSLYPLWALDIAGSLAMLLFSVLCMRQVMVLYRRDREDALNTYLLWLITALFAFCIFRSVGHLVKYLLVFAGFPEIWSAVSPLSGGLITVAFVVIFAVTLFFRNVLVFMNRMTSDRARIESTSRQLLSLNQDIESVVSDRTRAEMALNLAHEIRNPVMIIGGMLRRLNRAASEDARPSEAYRREIKQQVDQLESLVARFEDMQSASREHFKTVELNALLQDVLEIVRPEAEDKGITLELLASPYRLPFLGNQQYIKAALLHLLRNSIEACRAGDHVQVRTIRDARGVVARIEDNGPGIPKHVLEHVFEPFYSTRDGATGLGLPYVRQIIQEHRGEIRVDSSPGQGATVELVLPSHLTEFQHTG